MKLNKYNKIRNELKTGDIVLFSGKGRISTGIKWFTSSEWSHVGMVLRLLQFDMVLLWESTTLNNIDDVETGIAKKGVQVVSLSKRLQNYDGKAAIRQLSKKLSPKKIKSLIEFKQEVKNRPYEKQNIELLKSAFDGPFGRNREDLSSLFCSELVAESYQQMGLLPNTKIAKASNEYTPADFSSKSGCRNLQLQEGITLSKEMYL